MAGEKGFQHGRPFTIALKGTVRSVRAGAFLSRSQMDLLTCVMRLNEENRKEINVEMLVSDRSVMFSSKHVV